MENFVKDVQKWIDESEYPGPVIAALAHFGLISIHPFEDGNGRTARLLADMILQKTGWSNEGMLSVSEAILHRQQDYYDVLYETQGENFRPEVDARPFVDFHTEVLSMAAANLESAVVNFKQGLDRFIEQSRGFMSARQALAFMFMLDVAPLSTSALAELTGASQSAALSDLTQMVNSGYAQRIGQGRNTRYRVHPDLRKRIEDLASEPETQSTGDVTNQTA